MLVRVAVLLLLANAVLTICIAVKVLRAAQGGAYEWEMAGVALQAWRGYGAGRRNIGGLPRRQLTCEQIGVDATISSSV